jgi:hypothetical protein
LAETTLTLRAADAVGLQTFSLRVENAAGAGVRSIAGGTIGGATFVGSFVWDGRDDEGLVVPSGHYFVEGRVVDLADRDGSARIVVTVCSDAGGDDVVECGSGPDAGDGGEDVEDGGPPDESEGDFSPDGVLDDSGSGWHGSGSGCGCRVAATGDGLSGFDTGFVIVLLALSSAFRRLRAATSSGNRSSRAFSDRRMAAASKWYVAFPRRGSACLHAPSNRISILSIGPSFPPCLSNAEDRRKGRLFQLRDMTHESESERLSWARLLAVKWSNVTDGQLHRLPMRDVARCLNELDGAPLTPRDVVTGVGADSHDS